MEWIENGNNLHQSKKQNWLQKFALFSYMQVWIIQIKAYVHVDWILYELKFQVILDFWKIFTTIDEP